MRCQSYTTHNTSAAGTAQLVVVLLQIWCKLEYVCSGFVQCESL
jgi:hypothetical protein